MLARRRAEMTRIGTSAICHCDEYRHVSAAICEESATADNDLLTPVWCRAAADAAARGRGCRTATPGDDVFPVAMARAC
jgi:hypothetical protein